MRNYKKTTNLNKSRAFRIMLCFVVAFSVFCSTGSGSAALIHVWADTDEQTANETDISTVTDTENVESQNKPESQEPVQKVDEASESEVDLTIEKGPEASAAAVSGVTAGDFSVTGDDSDFSFEGGILTITGDVAVTMADGKTSTTDRIVVADDASVTLNGVTINASGGPAIKIKAGVKATLNLAEGSTNTATGAGNYAGVEAGWELDNLATLTLEGSGELNANGGSNSAGIGGSFSNKDSNGKSISSYCGNIEIKGNVLIRATGNDGGAGIGSGSNNRLNADGTSNTSSSYKMLTTRIGSGGTEPVIGNIVIYGGTIEATGSNSAGIGGGNHVDSGKITIHEGKIIAKGASGIGTGTGSHQYTAGQEGTKGPGYYYADITIKGGDIEARATGDDNWGGAGIGGGAYTDSSIRISGGNINAYGGNCGSGHNSVHHGGAGIGGGYEAHSDIVISGGTVNAYVGNNSAAAAIGSGGTPNSNPARGDTGRTTEEGVVHDTSTSVVITGGTVTADARNGRGGAGIGGGTSADKVEVTISGGTIFAYGAASNEDNKLGGAGIGGGLYGSNAKETGMTSPDNPKYHVETDVDVTITGGNVFSVGGWGASGIGSGARNKIANSVNIDVSEAKVEAYADGTKFAIDTRVLKEDGTTESYTTGRTITGDVIQGTFVHDYKQPLSDGSVLDQGTEGLKSIQIINDKTGESKELTKMPPGYRSFATDVNGEGAYTVYTDDPAISNGSGRYFNKAIYDTRTEEAIRTGSDILERNVQYNVKSNGLCDNFYLFPVKTVVVEKLIKGEGSEGLNATVMFCLKAGDDYAHEPGKSDVWTESIEIKNGVPQTKAYFVNVDDKKYDVLEIKGINEDGSVNTDLIGSKYGSYTLSKITTQHGAAVQLSPGTIHDDDRKITYTVTQSGDELNITASMDMAGGQPEGNPVTLSIFADGSPSDYPSKKLNPEDGWTQSWTVPVSVNGRAISYSIADTSNNAQINDTIWNDEVMIYNTFVHDTPPGPDPKPDPKPDPDDPSYDDSEGPKTGDYSHVVLYGAVFLTGLIALAGAGIYIYRKRKKEDR